MAFEDSRERDSNATFSGNSYNETLEQNSGHDRKNSVHFTNDFDYFNSNTHNSVDRHLENDLSHSRFNEEEVETVNKEEVSFFKEYLKNDSGE